MAVRNGSTVFLKLSTAIVDGSTNQDFETIVDILDVTTKDSTGSAKEKIAGEIDHKVNIEGKFAEGTSRYSIEDIFDAVEARVSVPYVFGGVSVGDMIISGNCILSNFKWSAPKNGECTWSLSIEGTGGVTRGTVSA